MASQQYNISFKKIKIKKNSSCFFKYTLIECGSKNTLVPKKKQKTPERDSKHDAVTGHPSMFNRVSLCRADMHTKKQ